MLSGIVIAFFMQSAMPQPEQLAVRILVDSILEEAFNEFYPKTPYHVRFRLPRETESFQSTLFHLDKECLDRQLFPKLFTRVGDKTASIALLNPTKKKRYKIRSIPHKKGRREKMKLSVLRASKVSEDLNLVSMSLYNKTSTYSFFIFMNDKDKLIRWCRGSAIR